ncbi:MAG: NADH-quinone oxidoreductase subunit L [Anaerolineae bacterium]|jgi:NADH-quinone oxidoreductase subunit L
MELNLELMIWLIPVFPFLAFGLIALFTNRWNGLSHWVAIGALLISVVLGMIVVFNAVGEGGHHMGEHPFADSEAWLPTGDTFMLMGVLVDPLTAMTLFFVLVTLLAIFVYSVGYMNYGTPHQDPRYARFFALISLFATGMLGLVVSDNLLMLFIFWEIMGFCSYSLIGFWYDKNYPDPKQITPRQAGVKAFMTTRVGDVLFLLGIAYLYSQTGTLSFREVFDPHMLEHLVETSAPALGLSAAGLIGLLIFAGTVGKSAQFPLHVWLPDAMEGPTPVSALIHAATMVSAGVYLAIRTFPLLSAGLGHDGGVGTAPMIAMGLIGAFTAFFAASIAMAQYDVKKVLAYSTISQLGYMVAALGVGAYIAAAFHLITHAFFKALLFLGSGSVIHGMEHGHHEVAHHGHGEHEEEYFDPQDMRNMGGLKDKMPWTFWTFLAGGMALSGFPFITAGFWSKDEILAEAFHGGTWLSWVVFGLLALSALMTAFYTMRQIVMTFIGKPRTEAAAHAHESSWWMVAPLVLLAFFAITAGFVGIPNDLFGADLGEINWIHDFVGSTLAEHPHAVEFSWIPLLVSLLVALGGLGLGILVYRDKLESPETPDPVSQMPILGFLFPHMHRKWYFDEIYEAVFVQYTKRAAKWIYEFIDRTVIDGILHTVARGAQAYAYLNRAFDRAVVNGGADWVAYSLQAFGRSFRQIQTGLVQNYLFLALINALVLVVVYLALFQ